MFERIDCQPEPPIWNRRVAGFCEQFSVQVQLDAVALGADLQPVVAAVRVDLWPARPLDQRFPAAVVVQVERIEAIVRHAEQVEMLIIAAVEHNSSRCRVGLWVESNVDGNCDILIAAAERAPHQRVWLGRLNNVAATGKCEDAILGCAHAQFTARWAAKRVVQRDSWRRRWQRGCCWRGGRRPGRLGGRL